MTDLPRAKRLRRAALFEHPGAERQAVQPFGVRVTPGIVGIDGPREGPERLFAALIRGQIPGIEPRRVLAQEDALGEPPRGGAGERRVGRFDRQAQLRGQFQVRGVELRDDLAAHLQRSAVGELNLFDAAAGAIARLQHDHVHARAHQVPRAGEPGEAGSQDEHVRRHGTPIERRFRTGRWCHT